MMDNDLLQTLKILRLYGLIKHWDEYLALANRKKFSPVRLLKYVLEQELSNKNHRARELRMKRARLPEQLLMETFPFGKQPKLNRKKMLSIYDAFDYMTHPRNVIWLGPTGCGKTGLASAFLIQAIEKGYTGRHVLFADLLFELYQSVADHSEEKVLKRYLSWDCLFIDEMGYVDVEPVQAGLFFTLMHRRHRKKSTLITSNLGFDDWRTFFKNDHLTAALIDRLTEDSHVINMKKCKSIRPKRKPDVCE